MNSGSDGRRSGRFHCADEKVCGCHGADADDVNEYIKKIIIHAPDKSGGKRRQKVEIIFNFVDEVEIPVLAEPMIAESTLGRKKTA